MGVEKKKALVEPVEEEQFHENEQQVEVEFEDSMEGIEYSCSQQEFSSHLPS